MSILFVHFIVTQILTHRNLPFLLVHHCRPYHDRQGSDYPHILHYEQFTSNQKLELIQDHRCGSFLYRDPVDVNVHNLIKIYCAVSLATVRSTCRWLGDWEKQSMPVRLDWSVPGTKHDVMGSKVIRLSVKMSSLLVVCIVFLLSCQVYLLGLHTECGRCYWLGVKCYQEEMNLPHWVNSIFLGHQ